jgi:hypothetical protein
MSLFSELAVVVSNLAKFVGSAGDQKLRRYLEDCHSKISNQQFTGVEKLLAAYVGTMGSLNDVCGNTEGNHAQLELLRDRAYELAVAIRAQRNG